MAERTSTDTFKYIWLDDTLEKSSSNIDTKSRIRQIVRGHLVTFTDPDQCIDYILTEITTEKVFLIVSNKLGQNVIPLVYEIPEIQIVYVYCGNRQVAETWAKKEMKVRGIFTKKQDLLKQICDDVGTYNNDNIPMSIFHIEDKQNSLQKINQDNVKFMWYQLIIIVLRFMAKYCNAKDEMVEECLASYHDLEIVKSKIHQFKENYTPTEAFKWYTADSFVYRLLNKALRTQHIEIIFKFRFFINDLHNQITRLYQDYLTVHPSRANRQLTVYRGQRMTIKELESLKQNVNQLISMNSFLSATTIREIAEIYADTSDQINEQSPLQSVVFIIEIHDINKDTTAFAFIQNYSCCPDEEEILFTIGAIFRVKSITEDKTKKMWHVHLQLDKQQNKDCQDFFHYLKNQVRADSGPVSLGWFLYRMNDFNKAERYAQLLLKQLPSDDKEIGNTYNLLGLIYKDLKRFSDAIECYNKALQIYSNPNYHNSSQIIAIHYNLGLVYVELGDERNAHEHLKKVESNLIKSSQTMNPLLIVMTDRLKAKLHDMHGDYYSALNELQSVLSRKQKTLPANHISIATTLNDLGIIEEKLNHDEQALEYFKQALTIAQKCLESEDRDSIDYHTNIGRIYYKREQYSSALEQFNKAFEIYNNFIREETDTIPILFTCIQQTQEKLRANA